MALFFSRDLQSRSFFPRRNVVVALLSGLLLTPMAVSAAQEPQQQQTPAASAAQTDLPAGTTAAQDNVQTEVLSNRTTRKKTRKSSGEKTQKTQKSQAPKEKIVKSKDTVESQRRLKRQMKDNPLANVDSSQPDKQLYDRALVALKKGKFDVSRLLLQDMLATYPDSEYQMRAKLAFADSWYREGGTAALTQAEAEYHDFIIFFPNAPEAAEAQMRIGDIYFKQMDKPDRDYTKAVHAQEEYRNMLTQYPDSTLIPEAKQKLREVQEVLATREASIGDFYLGRENYAAAIARLQTVVDTYPLYSKVDSVLIGLGDAYAAQARFVRISPNMKNLREEQRSRLLKVYESQAAAAYSRVVLLYSASPRVEDARDRLEALGAPIPEPTPEQVAASQALESSRQSYNLANRAKILLFSKPDVVQASRVGEPSMADPKPTLAPKVVTRLDREFKAAVNGTPSPTDAEPKPSGEASDEATGTAPAVPVAAAPASLSDIPEAGAAPPAGDSSGTSSFTDTPTGVAPVSGESNRNVGVTILTPGAASKTTDTGNGLDAVGPANNSALPPVEKPETAPDAVNDVSGAKTPVGQAPPEPNAKGKVKKPTPEFDKDLESSSKHKKKKGIKKVNPF